MQWHSLEGRLELYMEGHGRPHPNIVGLGAEGRWMTGRKSLARREQQHGEWRCLVQGSWKLLVLLLWRGMFLS